MDESERYTRAKHRVEELKSFYTHLIVYIVVNLGLFLINILTSPRTLWFYWPLFGWGIGVVAHGLGVFGGGKILGREWENKKIKEIMEKDKSKGE